MEKIVLQIAISQAVEEFDVAPATDTSIIALVKNAGPMVLFVLLLLVAFSVICWGIIFYKRRQLNKAAIMSQKFLDSFWQAEKLDDMYANRKAFEGSPILEVFIAGYKELNKALKSRKNAENGDEKLHMKMSAMDMVKRALRRQAVDEVTRLESLVSFLATIGSTAPFIGLFGTVWGIMNSFQEIGRMGSASIATVAPGISEALIATAAGLAAAIPAVIAYNYFISRIKVLDNEMENFSSDFLNIIERFFTQN
ncbi:MAG: protein TolQ [Myxococcota bacterium]